MSERAQWLTPDAKLVYCIGNHSNTIATVLEADFEDREEAILTGISKGYIRVSLVDNEWLLQLKKLEAAERKIITAWAAKRQINRDVSIEILGGQNFNRIETNVIELAEGINVSRRKIIKKAWVAPALVALHGIPTSIEDLGLTVVPSSGPPVDPCNQPNKPLWCRLF